MIRPPSEIKKKKIDDLIDEAANYDAAHQK